MNLIEATKMVDRMEVQIAALQADMRELESRFLYARNMIDHLPECAVSIEPEIKELLTKRQAQCMILVGRGLTNVEIGNELNIALGTVKNTMVRIFDRLGTRNRTEAAARALVFNV